MNFPDTRANPWCTVDLDERERFIPNAYEVALSLVKHHVNTWHKMMGNGVFLCGFFFEQCVLRDRWSSLVPRSLLLRQGLFSPSVAFSLRLHPSLCGLTLQILSSLCEYSGFVRHPNLLTHMYPRTLIFSSDLFQCFGPRSSTPAQISISGPPSQPTARQTHGCTEHTVSVRKLILCSPALRSVVDQQKRPAGVCSVTGGTGFALITGSLESIFVVETTQSRICNVFCSECLKVIEMTEGAV